MNNFNISSFGVISGALLGAMKNFARDKSFYSKDLLACHLNPFPNNLILKSINSVKENIPTSFFLTCLSEPANLYNSYMKRAENEYGVIGFFKTHLIRHRSKQVYYFYHNFLAEIIAEIFRKILTDTPFFISNKIYISGHVIRASKLTLGTIQALDHTDKHNGTLQKNFLKTLTLINGITDLIWVYNTSANCHSIIEVALGFGLFIGANYSLNTIESGISKTKSAVKNLICKPISNETKKIK